MFLKTKFSILTALSLLAATALPGSADEIADKGRPILTRNQRAVVTMQLVLKITAGRSSESKAEITGTVVDPSGLTVVSLSSFDPSEMYRRMNEGAKVDIDVEVTDLKILMEDSTEIAAEVVLRDKDLDLAFIRPKSKPASPMPFVDLTKASTAQALDQVVTINRLNRAAGRAYAGSVERISAVIQKPRTFYIPDSNMTATTSGSPAFALDGNVLGLFVIRMVGSGGGSSARDGLTSIILPADTILKAAKQVPEAKPEDSTKEK